MVVHIYKIRVFDEAFFLSMITKLFVMVYDHQTFQDGDMLQGALTHIYAYHLNGVTLWGHVTNKTHIFTCRRCIDTTLGKALT